MLKINRDIEIQLLKECKVGTFDDLQKLNISASTVSPSEYNYYIYYNLEAEGPFLVTDLEGKVLASKDRNIKYEKEMVCHCLEHNMKEDEFLYNGTDMIHLYEYYKCVHCSKEYKIQVERNDNFAMA